ncbi:MAG: hypothetical protein IJM83_03495 [Firmicutes bacterium]|nr:hypothetical protein [Bacillota bacterium]
MDLIKNADSLYEEYEALLLERDQLEKEIGRIWTAYQQLFGKLISDVYEEKTECIKCQKIIAYYQNALNHGGIVDSAAMEDYLEKEMRVYYANLDQMLKENEAANEADPPTPNEVQQAKTLYRRLAKWIHPDIYPETDSSDELKELWERILTAYHHNDVKELSELEVLIQRALKELGSDETRIDVQDIEEKIDELKNEINSIIHAEPYVLRYYLDYEDAAERKTAELKAELESYQKYHKELAAMILQMLQCGGLMIHVDIE